MSHQQLRRALLALLISKVEGSIPSALTISHRWTAPEHAGGRTVEGVGGRGAGGALPAERGGQREFNCVPVRLDESDLNELETVAPMTSFRTRPASFSVNPNRRTKSATWSSSRRPVKRLPAKGRVLHKLLVNHRGLSS